MEGFRHFGLNLLCLCLLPFSSCFSAVPHIVVQVGRMAALPCSWTRPDIATSRSSYPLHFQWQTPQETVLELKDNLFYQGSGYKGRVDLFRDRIAEGDCSLHLQEVRYSDAGLYESFIILAYKNKKTRKFLHNVQLRVTDHKSTQILQTGAAFNLSLQTSQATMVIFQGSADMEETVMWEKVGERSNKRKVEEDNGALIFHSLELSDSGIYKVLDPDGLIISTTLLRVKEVSQEPDIKGETFAALGADKEVHSEGSSVSGSFTTITVFLLCSSLIRFVL